jgi:transcriptional regulator with XRE-family HTH domain
MLVQIQSTFGEALAVARAERALSMAKVAELANEHGGGEWTRQTVNGIEKGERGGATEGTVRRYAAALGMDVVLVLVPKGTRAVRVEGA